MFYDAHTEELEYEHGAALGDPRRCASHPGIVISSPNGMIDGLCWKCEQAADEAALCSDPPVLDPETAARIEAEILAMQAANAARPMHPCGVGSFDDDIPF